MKEKEPIKNFASEGPESHSIASISAWVQCRINRQ